MLPVTSMAEVLGRSRASLSPAIREVLAQGRTVRSRNRDGEYAIVLAPDAKVVRHGAHSVIEGIDHLADALAAWTIVVTGFTFDNVSKHDDDFFAPVFARGGERVGTIRVNNSARGKTTSDQGQLETDVVFFTTLRAGDLFREAETDSAGRVILFRATADATADGYVTAETVGGGEHRVFDLGPDYLAFKVV